MVYKNRTVTLLGQPIHVKYEKDVMLDGSAVFGKTEWSAARGCTITICIEHDGEKISPEEVERTLRHELFHAIFNRLYMNNENENETIVEWLATATWELNKQGLKI